ncbi:MAG: beta-lactamase family protein [Candidatus Heimdallarchaeota archaeon]|nr:beta-lactamase family protein [Candidatus Heimdallarchaeota archaeon]
MTETLHSILEQQTRPVVGRLDACAISCFDSSTTHFEYFKGKNQLGNNVDDFTLFSIQSISKTITSTLVMIAIQEGLINLDAPIGTYLPDFTVQSSFEDNPSHLITIHHLLTHTSGLAHEAPIGNNYQPGINNVSQHLQSIRNTWLKFKVGTGYSYSNLGYDLLAYIIEKQSGIPFEQYLNQKLLKPLEMKNTYLAIREYEDQINMVNGNSFGVSTVPNHIPMIGAVSILTCINDLKKFIRFHLNFGDINGKNLLAKEMLFQMYKPHLVNHYSLGVVRILEEDIISLSHNGQGFGFSATIKWSPEYGLGAIMLCNSERSDVTYTHTSTVLSEAIKQLKLKRIAIENLPVKVIDENDKPVKEFLTLSSSPIDPSISGTYIYKLGPEYHLKWYAKLARKMKIKIPSIKLRVEDGLFLSIYDGLQYQGEEKLIQYKENLFFDSNGDTLEIIDNKIFYRNIELE